MLEIERCCASCCALLMVGEESESERLGRRDGDPAMGLLLPFVENEVLRPWAEESSCESDTACETDLRMTSARVKNYRNKCTSNEGIPRRPRGGKEGVDWENRCLCGGEPVERHTLLPSRH
jgi:hypothetical protein